VLAPQLSGELVEVLEEPAAAVSADNCPRADMIVLLSQLAFGGSFSDGAVPPGGPATNFSPQDGVTFSAAGKDPDVKSAESSLELDLSSAAAPFAPDDNWPFSFGRQSDPVDAGFPAEAASALVKINTVAARPGHELVSSLEVVKTDAGCGGHVGVSPGTANAGVGGGEEESDKEELHDQGDW
jgi:hypothetical protein